MGSDSFTRASAPVLPKDLSKKKRTNRLAKLKQNKLDVRREQWLSQVKNKGSNMDSNRRGKSPPSLLLSNEQDRSLDNLKMGSRVGDEVLKIHDSEFGSLVDSPSGSIIMDFTDSTNSLGGSSGSSSCSSSSHCFSGCISEEEVDDGCLNDWEAFADALNANENQNHSSDCLVKPDTGGGSTSPNLHDKNFAADMSKTNTKSCHAWRPDDAFRPQSLPHLPKQQHGFPRNSDRHCADGATVWAWQRIVPQPSSCPICYEDLDITDSSFIPCSCGFRLCLFCHKRIIEADSRCPGCRKQYDCAEGRVYKHLDLA